MQELAWIITLILMLALLFVFVFVYMNSAKQTDDELAQKKFLAWRGKFFWGMVAAFVVISFQTLGNLPYEFKDTEAATNAQEVEVTGYQWNWKLSRDKFVVNQPVLFTVKSGDVNHGMGVYDDSLTLLTQTQAMPGYANQVGYTFSEPGVYKIFCLEYCGVGHHDMVASFEVVEVMETTELER